MKARPLALLLAVSSLSALSAFAANNSLTESERADGYEPLWNGNDLDGWRTYGIGTFIPREWTVVQDSAKSGPDCGPSGGNALAFSQQGYDLYTVDSGFQDFDLKIEWRTPIDGREPSGLAYRYRAGVGKNLEASAARVPLLNGRWSEWRLPLYTAGSDYDMVPILPSRIGKDSAPNWTRPNGEWNTLRVIAFGKRVAHYGNGVRLLEYEMLSDAWYKTYRESKFAPFPNYATVHPGSILLQGHGNIGMRFRNLRIKRLTRDPWAAGSVYLQKGDLALRDTLAQSENLFPLSPASQAQPGHKPAAEPARSGTGFRKNDRRYDLRGATLHASSGG